MSNLAMIITTASMLAVIGANLYIIRCDRAQRRDLERMRRQLDIAAMYRQATAAYQRGDRIEGDRLKAVADHANTTVDGEAS